MSRPRLGHEPILTCSGKETTVRPTISSKRGSEAVRAGVVVADGAVHREDGRTLCCPEVRNSCMDCRQQTDDTNAERLRHGLRPHAKNSPTPSFWYAVKTIAEILPWSARTVSTTVRIDAGSAASPTYVSATTPWRRRCSTSLRRCSASRPTSRFSGACARGWRPTVFWALSSRASGLRFEQCRALETSTCVLEDRLNSGPRGRAVARSDGGRDVDV